MLNREKWIIKAMEIGKISYDYADTLYLAYTEFGSKRVLPKKAVEDHLSKLSPGSYIPNIKLNRRGG